MSFSMEMSSSDVVILSDYGKGKMCDIEALIAEARKQKKPVLIDPKGSDYRPYRGATLLTPNMTEFEAVVGKCRDEAEIVTKGEKLRAELDLSALLITRSEHGMTLIQPGQAPPDLAAGEHVALVRVPASGAAAGASGAGGSSGSDSAATVWPGVVTAVEPVADAQGTEVVSVQLSAAQALLTWYIVERMDDAERGRVEAHLCNCPRCQGDVAWQRARCAARDEGESSADVEHGLAAMLAKIGAEERTSAPAAVADPPRVGGPVHVRFPGRRPMASAWWRWALGFQFAAILGLALLLVIPGSPDHLYRTLGAPIASSANLVVVFRPTATEAEIRQALRASEARLVGGPTVTDAYLLSAAPAQRIAALERLRSDPAVIRVGSLDATPK